MPTEIVLITIRLSHDRTTNLKFHCSPSFQGRDPPVQLPPEPLLRRNNSRRHHQRQARGSEVGNGICKREKKIDMHIKQRHIGPLTPQKDYSQVTRILGALPSYYRMSSYAT